MTAMFVYSKQAPFNPLELKQKKRGKGKKNFSYQANNYLLHIRLPGYELLKASSSKVLFD